MNRCDEINEYFTKFKANNYLVAFSFILPTLLDLYILKFVNYISEIMLWSFSYLFQSNEGSFIFHITT